MAMSKDGYRRKQRNSGLRKRRPLIFLNAEGKNKTESFYLKDFAQDYDRVISFASGNHTDPVNMVNELGIAMDNIGFEPDPGDKAFCLIDSDFNPSKNPQILQAIALAERKNIQVIVSSPCFEIWYICHFHHSTRHYTCNDDVLVEPAAQLTGYTKNAAGIYEKLKPYLVRAIQNAKRLEQNCFDSGYAQHTTEFAPSTEMYLLAEEIMRPL